MPIAITETAWRQIRAPRGTSHQDGHRALRVLRAASSAVLETLPQLGRVGFRVRSGGPLVIEFHESDVEQLVATILARSRGRPLD